MKRAHDARVTISPVTGTIELDAAVQFTYQEQADLENIELKLCERRKSKPFKVINPFGFNYNKIVFDVTATEIAKDLPCGITYGKLYIYGCYVSTIEILKEIGWAVTKASTTDLCVGTNGFEWDCCPSRPCRCPEIDDCPLIFCSCCGHTHRHDHPCEEQMEVVPYDDVQAVFYADGTVENPLVYNGNSTDYEKLWLRSEKEKAAVVSKIDYLQNELDNQRVENVIETNQHILDLKRSLADAKSTADGYAKQLSVAVGTKIADEDLLAQIKALEARLVTQSAEIREAASKQLELVKKALSSAKVDNEMLIEQIKMVRETIVEVPVLVEVLAKPMPCKSQGEDLYKKFKKKVWQ
jgi:hypothetical protein